MPTVPDSRSWTPRAGVCRTWSIVSLGNWAPNFHDLPKSKIQTGGLEFGFWILDFGVWVLLFWIGLVFVLYVAAPNGPVWILELLPFAFCIRYFHVRQEISSAGYFLFWLVRHRRTSKVGMRQADSGGVVFLIHRAGMKRQHLVDKHIESRSCLMMLKPHGMLVYLVW